VLSAVPGPATKTSKVLRLPTQYKNLASKPKMLDPQFDPSKQRPIVMGFKADPTTFGAKAPQPKNFPTIVPNPGKKEFPRPTEKALKVGSDATSLMMFIQPTGSHTTEAASDPI